MPYLFSATMCAFFHTEVPDPSIPEDVVELTDAEHESLMQEILMGGKRLQADEMGAPVAVEASAGPEVLQEPGEGEASSGAEGDVGESAVDGVESPQPDA